MKVLKIKILVFYSLLSFLVLPLGAQTGNNLRTSEIFDAPLIGRNYLPPPKGKGSPYLYDNWLNGYVVFISGDTVKNKLFKFDCLKNEFVWMADGKSMIALDHHLINSFALFPNDGRGIRKFEKTSLKIPFISDSLVRYLEVLASGRINLYSFRRIETGSEETHGYNGGIYQVNSYFAEPIYFIQTGNLPVKQVRFSKRSIYEAYPENAATLKKIFRSNHLGGLRNEYQLIRAIELLNEKWQ